MQENSERMDWRFQIKTHGVRKNFIWESQDIEEEEKFNT